MSHGNEWQPGVRETAHGGAGRASLRIGSPRRRQCRRIWPPGRGACLPLRVRGPVAPPAAPSRSAPRALSLRAPFLGAQCFGLRVRACVFCLRRRGSENLEAASEVGGGAAAGGRTRFCPRPPPPCPPPHGVNVCGRRLVHGGGLTCAPLARARSLGLRRCPSRRRFRPPCAPCLLSPRKKGGEGGGSSSGSCGNGCGRAGAGARRQRRSEGRGVVPRPARRETPLAAATPVVGAEEPLRAMPLPHTELIHVCMIICPCRACVCAKM